MWQGHVQYSMSLFDVLYSDPGWRPSWRPSWRPRTNVTENGWLWTNFVIFLMMIAKLSQVLKVLLCTWRFLPSFEVKISHKCVFHYTWNAATRVQHLNINETNEKFIFLPCCYCLPGMGGVGGTAVTIIVDPTTQNFNTHTTFTQHSHNTKTKMLVIVIRFCCGKVMWNFPEFQA